MIFSKKFAKIGRSKIATIRKRTDGTFDVLMSNDQTTRRNLVINGTSYNLGQVSNTYIYNQMKMISDTLCIASVDGNNYSIVELD